MSDLEPAELLFRHGLSDNDLGKVRQLAPFLAPSLERVFSAYDNWLNAVPSRAGLLGHGTGNDNGLADYWRQFLQAKVDRDFIDSRTRLGSNYAELDVSLPACIESHDQMFALLLDLAASQSHRGGGNADVIASLSRLLHLDLSLITSGYLDKRDELLALQSHAVMEMSTPVTEIWEGILLLPLVGLVDSRRSEDIMHAVLNAISATHAREFILDISGVGVVDTAVANYLIKITRATALMGCESTISGISPAIARTIVQLGVDVGQVRTTATMMDALSNAFARQGITLSGHSRILQRA